MFGISVNVLVVVGGMILAILLLFSFIAQMFRKAGPNEAFVVYGFRGTRVIKGGGTVIFPMFESYRALSLELMSFDVAPQKDVYTKQGVAVTVEAVAQIKVRSDRESIETAAEQFLTKTPAQREGLIRLVMEGHLRGIIGQLSVEEIVKQPEMVADRMRATSGRPMLVMYSFLSRTSLMVNEITSCPILFISSAQVERIRSPTISGSLTICSTVSCPMMPRRCPSITRRIRLSR